MVILEVECEFDRFDVFGCFDVFDRVFGLFDVFDRVFHVFGIFEFFQKLKKCCAIPATNDTFLQQLVAKIINCFPATCNSPKYFGITVARFVSSNVK